MSLTVKELIRILQDLPQDREIVGYCSELQRKGDRSAYNWVDIDYIKPVDCEHDDYVLMQLSRCK